MISVSSSGESTAGVLAVIVSAVDPAESAAAQSHVLILQTKLKKKTINATDLAKWKQAVAAK